MATFSLDVVTPSSGHYTNRGNNSKAERISMFWLSVDFTDGCDYDDEGCSKCPRNDFCADGRYLSMR
ncbi:hypothetical protein CEXT_637581 [Caerostris extrusa]|uniref:Uncharacterized protein n=1 Tax=Caerostris extrusa TaxID=172846 RepID=A0AAV4RM04_CAEEX|nr:hypothetical protein CEXT_637581 [Caerostris extrusa]